MRVLFCHADNPKEWNTSAWRCITPSKSLNTIPGWIARDVAMMKIMTRDADALELAAGADIIIVERLLIADILQQIEVWKAQGKVVLGTIDDDYRNMPKSISSYYFWHEGRVTRADGKTETLEYPPIEQLVWGGKLVDGLLVASKKLVEDWKKFTPRVYYFPNLMDTEHYIQYRTDRKSNIITLGWGGSLTHVESWKNSGILSALQDVIRERSNTNILIGGGDERIFELIPVPRDRKSLAPWVAPEHWPGIVARFDIGLIPLSGLYDERRSHIKAIEYMVMGIPWVGSNYVTLADVADLGVLALNSHHGWKNALLHMVDNFSEYKARAMSMRDQYPRIDIAEQAGVLANTIMEAVANCGRTVS